MKHTISIPSSSFLKEGQQEYSSLNVRLPIELIQNILDANGTIIKFHFNKGVLTVLDNGHGMDEINLKKGMLTYGGSVKNEKSVGGFGAFKKLLFANQSYRIQTNELVALGRGINYRLYSRTKLRDCIMGTKITIRFSKNWPRYSDLGAVLYESLKDTLLRSNLAAQVYWNGELLKQAAPSPIEIESETAIIRKSDLSNEITVRFNGLFMFKKYSNHGYFYDCKGHSRAALTQNRESFRQDTQFQTDYSDFVSTLNNNTISGVNAQASYQRTKDTTTFLEGVEFRGNDIPKKIGKRNKTIFAFCQVVADMVGFRLNKDNFGFYSDSCCKGLCSGNKIWLNNTFFAGENWEMEAIEVLLHEIIHAGGWHKGNNRYYMGGQSYHNEEFISSFGEIWVEFMGKFTGLNPLKAKAREVEKQLFS